MQSETKEQFMSNRMSLAGPPPNFEPISNANQSTSKPIHVGDFLGADYKPDELILDEKGNVIGGTLEALVCKLTSHNNHEASFDTSFFLTYRSITTSLTVFHLLRDRFTMFAPAGLDVHQVKLWTDKKLKIIRIRVFAALKCWLEHHIQDDPHDRMVLVLIGEFATLYVKPLMVVSYQTLSMLVEKRMKSNCLVKPSTDLSTPPVPLLPKNVDKFKLYELEPLEVARQLTFLESNLYVKVNPSEFLGVAWGLEIPMANIEKLQDFS